MAGSSRKLADFGIGTVTVGRLDGTGDALTVPFTPSATIRTQVLAEKSALARRSPGYVMAFFSIADAGKLADFGIEAPSWRDVEAVEDAILEFFAACGLGTDGQDGENTEQGEDPTTASD